MRRLASGVGLSLVCFGALAEEASPSVEKTGVDAALQKRIDEAITKARVCLEKLCCEGDSKTVQTRESLRQQADAEQKRADVLRRQAQDLREGSGDSKTMQRVHAFLEQARAADRQAEALRKKSDRLGRNPAPPEEPKREPAPAAAFKHKTGELALIGLALVQAGLKPSDPLLQGVWERLRKAQPADFIGKETYTLGVSLMFVDGMMHSPSGEAWPSPELRAQVSDWVQKSAETLAAGCDGGAWAYACRYAVPGDARKYTVSGDALG